MNSEYILEMLFIDPDYRKNNMEIIVWKDIEQKSGLLKLLII